MSNQSERPEKWQRLLEAAKASRQEHDGDARLPSAGQVPEGLSVGLLSRLRALRASLNSWKRWSLIAGLISIIIYLASLVYLKWTSADDQNPIIEIPRLELPSPPTPDKRQP